MKKLAKIGRTKNADQLGTTEIEHRQSGHSKCHQLAVIPMLIVRGRLAQFQNLS
jgi:hypothetical protein